MQKLVINSNPHSQAQWQIALSNATTNPDDYRDAKEWACPTPEEKLLIASPLENKNTLPHKLTQD
ncbi:MAG: hypothetical protein GX437_12575 [Sphingobacteriales bacterium]|nr:hypothetical protein [Sphingobacteriales bacterium]